jgi:hypothetical protein
MKRCTWKCGRRTKNRTGIDDRCWRDRERIYQARKADKLTATRRAKLANHLPATVPLNRKAT